MKILIKSQSNGRIRLKSELFKADFLDNFKFKEPILHARLNAKCQSLVINYDPKITNLDKILADFGYKIIKPQEETLSCACGACSIVNPKKSLKKDLIEFGALSAYALAGICGVSFSPLVGFGVCFIAGIPLLKSSIEDIKNRKFTLQTFMSFTLIGSVFVGEISTAFEVIYILRGGMLLESYAANRSKDKVRELLESDIKKAFVLVGDVEIETNIDDVKVGDVVVVKEGEKIPVDGEILSGTGQISEALINGRSEPSLKSKGEKVYSNTLLEKGNIHIKVQAVKSGTYISRVVAQVENALASRSQSEKIADELARNLLSLGTVLTLGTWAITGSFLRAFSVMIVMSCPCSTILAASSAISTSIVRSAKEGILVKGGKYLENFAKTDVICFDKTGTLTTGKPSVVEVYHKDCELEELFYLASIAEYRNNHPIAIAIKEYSKKFDIKIDKSIKNEAIVGLGAKVNFNGDEILVGNKALFEKFNISLKDLEDKIFPHTSKGRTIVYISKNQKVLGFIAFEHFGRAGIDDLVANFKARGVKKIVLLTGDDEKVANYFASKYGFDEIYANILPEQKASIVSKLKEEYNIVTMVGDGINDTIAMSKADVGISFASGGSEAAIEVSDIAITNSNIKDLVMLHDIGNTTLTIVKENYWIGTSTNLIGVVAAGLGVLSPVAAGGIHIAHTAGIMANASRIAFKKIDKSKKLERYYHNKI